MLRLTTIIYGIIIFFRKVFDFFLEIEYYISPSRMLHRDYLNGQERRNGYAERSYVWKLCELFG